MNLAASLIPQPPFTKGGDDYIHLSPHPSPLRGEGKGEGVF